MTERPSILIQHELSADGSDRILYAECSVCGARFPTPFETWIHQGVEHPIRDPKGQCS